MSHTSAAFNHSCLKVPLNPDNKLPAPIYEQKYINQIKNQELKENTPRKIMKANKTNQNSKYKAFIDFYGSIPDYSDVNHLSNKDFYRKLEALRARQKCYYEYLETELHLEEKDHSVLEYKDDRKKKTTLKESPKNELKPSLRATPESDTSSCKEIAAPPSRRSVRIESPKSDSTLPTRNIDSPKSPREKSWKRNISSADSKFSESSKYGQSLMDSLGDEDKDSCDDALKNDMEDDYKENVGSRSLPSSPVKKKNTTLWNDSGITIPKPFKMTVRDEEDRIVEEILARGEAKYKNKQDLFRAHDVPIESRIPMYDKIMEEQQIRSQIVKRRSKETLLSKMRPFSFTKREEEEQALTRRFSKSSPQLTYEEIPLKIKPFRAKPVPKNLFSNYIYARMHEDEFYRALKRRIRSEEMLKASSLPPSMAQRAKTREIKPICPRALRDMEKEIDNQLLKQELESNPSLAKMFCHGKSDNSEENFITLTKPFNFQTDKRCQKRARSAKRCHRAKEYESTEHKRAQSALELQSVNRSNLAAVLRIQSARKRMQDEMAQRLEEEKFQQEMRWREKVMRQKPVWQELNYTSEDDIAIRLQMRKDEERLRKEEHRHHMDIMLGRVQKIPTLLERQSQYSLEHSKDKSDKYLTD